MYHLAISLYLPIIGALGKNRGDVGYDDIISQKAQLTVFVHQSEDGNIPRPRWSFMLNWSSYLRSHVGIGSGMVEGHHTLRGASHSVVQYMQVSLILRDQGHYASFERFSFCCCFIDSEKS